MSGPAMRFEQRTATALDEAMQLRNDLARMVRNHGVLLETSLALLTDERVPREEKMKLFEMLLGPAKSMKECP